MYDSPHSQTILTKATFGELSLLKIAKCKTSAKKNPKSLVKKSKNAQLTKREKK